MDDFEEYLNGDDPKKAELARNWSIACGLQAVAGLRASVFLIGLAKRNIEGEITQKEVSKLLAEHYKSEKYTYPRDILDEGYEIIQPDDPRNKEIEEYNRKLRPKLYEKLNEFKTSN